VGKWITAGSGLASSLTVTGKYLIEMLHTFQTAYGKQMVSESITCEWHDRFKVVYESLDVDPCSITEQGQHERCLGGCDL
jgi:hypothetical protein